jgi:uncharacterized protein (PEP-CTERM system associated)
MESLRPDGMARAGRDTRLALVLGLAGLSVSGLAFAQAQQPQTPDVLGGPTGIQFGPSIGINQLFTDNAVGTQPGQPQLVTQISPGISIRGETPHLRIDFNYAPSFTHFDNGGSPDRVDQNFNTSGVATPIDNLTINFQGFATPANAAGNASNQQGILVPSNNRILYYVGNIAPHYQQQFGDFATLDITYGVNSANTSVEGTQVPGLGIGSTSSLGQNEVVSIGSAEAFGRLRLSADFSHTSSTGSGMNTESTTGVETVSLFYHINRTYTVSGSIGYQSIDYPANGLTPAYKSNGVTWTLGMTITPNALSTIALGYGKQQGAYNPSVQAGYALGPRTNISASYLVSVQNQLTASLQNLKYLTYDQFGNPIDSRTGLPFSGVNQSFGSQNVLFRDKPALVAISHQFTRSGVTLTGQYEVRNSLTGVSQQSQTLGATIGYSRQFTPLVQGAVNVGYTVDSSKTAGTPESRSRSVSLSGTVFYNLSDTTTINVVEDFFRNISNDSAQNSLTQQFTVSLRKSF